MTPQSHAQQMLESLYIGLLDRHAQRPVPRRVPRDASGFRPRMEELPSRLLLSVTAVGGDININATTSNNQIAPAIAVAPDGSFVAVWEADGNLDGNGRGIFGRRFAADGTPLSGDFIVNATTQGDQTTPAIAMDGSGNFVVAWTGPGTNKDIFMRRFDASANPLSGDILVNSFTSSDQLNPAIGMNSSGAFVVAWEGAGADDDHGVWAQQFDSSGAAVGTEFRVNAVLGANQYDASVAVAPDGSFVITHTDDSSGRYIAAQRYSAAGAGQGQFAVDGVTKTSGDSENISSVAIADNGSFVVTWAGSGGSSRIAARQFASDGTPLGAPFQVDPAATKEQDVPRISEDGAGNFIIAWQDLAIDSAGKGIGVAAFNPDGTANGSVLQANTYTNHDQVTPAIAIDGTGSAVTVWCGETAVDSSGIAAKRLDVSVVLPANQPPVNTVPGAPNDRRRHGTRVLSGVWKRDQRQ